MDEDQPGTGEHPPAQEGDVPPPPRMVTTTTVQYGQYKTAELVHRRTETVPVPDDEELPFPEPAQQAQSSMGTLANYGQQVTSRLSGIASAITSRLPNIRGFGGGSSRERWKLRVFANYQNENDDKVEDSMELEFGSKMAAENYWELQRLEMERAGKAIPCTVQIFRVDQNQPPPDSTQPPPNSTL